MEILDKIVDPKHLKSAFSRSNKGATNEIHLGDITLASNENSMGYLIKLLLTLLKEKEVQDYLEVYRKNRRTYGGVG